MKFCKKKPTNPEMVLLLRSLSMPKLSLVLNYNVVFIQREVAIKQGFYSRI